MLHHVHNVMDVAVSYKYLDETVLRLLHGEVAYAKIITVGDIILPAMYMSCNIDILMASFVSGVLELDKSLESNDGGYTEV